MDTQRDYNIAIPRFFRILRHCLAARHDRLTVIALGAFVWAAATFLIGFSTTFPQVRRGGRQLPCRFPLAAAELNVLGTMRRWR